MLNVPDFGALVVSLDFEIHWGVRYRFTTDGAYRENLLGVRRAVPEILRVFEEYGVAATWATVGFLFARSRAELEAFTPEIRPAYSDPSLSPYDEKLGEGEHDDPFHYGRSLIAAIQRSPRQEIATHTYSHYYCLEPGQNREAFRADISSAVAIAREAGVQFGSIVFPRNQHNPDYDDILWDAGIRCIRGNTRGWMNKATRVEETTLRMRGARLVNAYLPIGASLTVPWHTLLQANGLCNVPASLFLRPYSPRVRRFEPLRLRRLTELLHHAATAREIVHLYWHPHNFGVHLEENIAVLRGVLDRFTQLRERHGMRSLSMSDVADIALGNRHADHGVGRVQAEARPVAG